MPLQDLTPQLRTRLSRLERLVGLFVGVATLLLLAGLVYYVYQTAHRKGWFDRKLPYFTFVRSAAGLKVGDPVKLMGFDVGEITQITAQPAEDRYYDVFVAFRVKEPFYGYLWEHSRARVGASDFLGKRFIEVTKGTNGAPSYLFHEIKEFSLSDAESFLGTSPVFFVDEVYDDKRTNVLARPFDPLTKEVLDKITAAGSVATIRLIDTTNETRTPTGIWDYQEARYKPFNKLTYKGYFLVPDESPALTERLETVVDLVQGALPNVLDLTNQIQRVLENAAGTAAHADELLASARPIVTNLRQITDNLSNPHGALGEWLFPTNLS
ncbi:MAG TPA: MlaD family protein, partial [Candidatus Binatia bacterium]|nr:MlaD family protein [Candidatus Binatia bacterium]